MTEKIINNENLKEFLDSVGFGNGCCGCHNDLYEIEKPFVIIPNPERKADECL